jgi:hypothetical protein
MMNGGSPSSKKPEHAFSADDLLDAPLVSSDLPEGQYPARFMGISDGFILKSRFAKSGQAERINLRFAVKNTTTGQTLILSNLINPPARDKGGISSKSNMYKFLKPLGAGRADLWDGSIDNIKTGVTLRQFIGATCNVVVGKDKKGYLQVKDAVVPPPGMDFPTEAEAAEALARFLERDEERQAEQEMEDLAGGSKDIGW